MVRHVHASIIGFDIIDDQNPSTASLKKYVSLTCFVNHSRIKVIDKKNIQLLLKGRPILNTVQYKYNTALGTYHVHIVLKYTPVPHRGNESKYKS